MAAAITASDNGGNVTLFEHMPRIGKKLLMTGSGKCNISNEDMDLCHFHSADCELTLVKSVFSKISATEMLDFLSHLGLLTRNRNGYIYPYSEQASQVLDVLRFSLRDRNIRTCTECEIKGISSNKGRLAVEFENDKSENFDKIIIATGSCAYKSTGSDGSGFALCSELGHHVVKPLPALTYLAVEDKFIVSLAGIRTHAKVSICGSSETGELQLTKNGISGIPVFNLSFRASKRLDLGEKVIAEVDFLPEISEDSLRLELTKRCKMLSVRPVEELLVGILHKNLCNVIMKESSLRHELSQKCCLLSEEEIGAIAGKIKHFMFRIKANGGFDNSQVVAGGVDTTEITDCLESKRVSNLYLAGEVLDVNGDCGGYNLTWAFCSGIVAANAATGKYESLMI